MSLRQLGCTDMYMYITQYMYIGGVVLYGITLLQAYKGVNLKLKLGDLLTTLPEGAVTQTERFGLGSLIKALQVVIEQRTCSNGPLLH